MLQHTSSAELLGSGTSSQVFRRGPDRVVKLFRDIVPQRLVDREALASAFACAAGLPAPALLGRETHGVQAALVFAFVPGATLLATYRYRLFGALLALRRLARIHARVHRHAAPGGLPRQRDGIRWLLQHGTAAPAEQAAALAALDALSDDDRLCHGDLHPGNAMVPDARTILLIDWCKASAGSPAADVARSELLIRFAGHGSRTRPLDRALDLVRDALAWWYVRCYAHAARIAVADIRAWRLPLAVAWGEGHRTTRNVAFRRFLKREMRRAG